MVSIRREIKDFERLHAADFERLHRKNPFVQRSAYQGEV